MKKKNFLIIVHILLTSLNVIARDSLHAHKVLTTEERGDIYVGEIEHGRYEFIGNDGWKGDCLQETILHIGEDSIILMPGLYLEKEPLNKLENIIDLHNTPMKGHIKVRRSYYPKRLCDSARDCGVYFNIELPTSQSEYSEAVTMTLSYKIHSYLTIVSILSDCSVQKVARQ